MRKIPFLVSFFLAAGCGDAVGNVLTNGDGGASRDGTNDVELPIDGTQGGDCAQRTPGPCGVSDAGHHDASTTDSGAHHDSGTSGADGGFCPISCDPNTSFCELSYDSPSSDAGPDPFCLPFETPCADGGVAPSCACANVCPFGSCKDTGGEVVVVCPFHP